MRWYSYVCFHVLISLSAHALAQDSDFTVQELPPLQRVVFYNSGVAHMQHRGEVNGRTRLPIRFSAHDVDDVLKSLVFEDFGGGHVRAVEYQPAPNPEDVAANAFGPMTLAQLLQRYRGEQVTVVSELRARVDEDKGTIFGLENRQFGEETAEVLVLIDDEGGMRSFRLNDMFRVQFLNEEVQKEMKLAMTGVTKSRKANQKQLDLLFDGEGNRSVGFAYVVDAPIWRMTYRLDVKPEQVQLQGWTHINNVTGVDWEGVTVELRSGQPQTFHAELFAPVLAERESVGLNPFGLPEELTLVRQWYGFEPAARFGKEKDDDFGREGYGGGMGGMGGGMMGGGFGGGGRFGGSANSGEDNSRPRKGIDTTTAFQKIASLDRTGTTVRFQLDKPVDLPSGKSAALPVFKQSLPSRLLSVVKHQNPGDQLTVVKAIELTNATEFALVPGPINVSRDGDFVGDAQIQRVPIGATAMLPYSVDRAIQVTRETSPRKRSIKNVSLRGRRVVNTYENAFDIQFEIDNQDRDARLMVLEYLLPDFSVESGSKQNADDPFDRTETFAKAEEPESIEATVPSISPAPKKREAELLTYEVPAPAITKTPFKIQVRSPELVVLPLRDVSPTQARNWLRLSVETNDATKTKLQELIALSNELSQNENQLGRLAEQKDAYVKEQSRVRENLAVLGSSTSAAGPFLIRMHEMETAIRDVDVKIQTAQEENLKLQRKRNAL